MGIKEWASNMFKRKIKMTKHKLAIIGASYLQRPLVEKAKDMGIETHCFAWENGAVCKDISDFFYPISITQKELILQECKRIGIDGIATIASDLAVITVNYVATEMGLNGNDFIDSEIQTNKYAMRKALSAIDPQSMPLPSRQAHLFVPNFLIYLTTDSGFKETLNFPIIVKPTDRSGSRGVTKVFDEKERTEAINRAIAESLSKQVIIEEYVDGSEVSVESISYKGKHFVLQITDKITTGSPYFVELEHHQPSSLEPEIKEKIKQLVPVALDALHIKNGASHTEIKITSDGELKIIEIGARMGGDFIGSDLVQLSTGYDFLKGVIQVALDEFEEPVLLKTKYSGVYFLSAETPDILNYITEAVNYREIVKSEITDTKLHHIKESADRSGYFIYQSNKRFLV